MTKTLLIKLLKSCSKAELTEIVLKASELTYPTFPWKTIIAEIRTEEIGRKIDANFKELDVLRKKFNSIPESERVMGNDEARNLLIAIHNNHTKYCELNKRLDKVEKELCI